MLQRSMQVQLERSALNQRNSRLEQCFPNTIARGPFLDSKMQWILISLLRTTYIEFPGDRYPKLKKCISAELISDS